MKFDRLEASIFNNRNEEPSLYMALCMVESLFLDMEQGCGTGISLCPAGDAQLPSKLIWLCRTINNIYADHDEDLQRNRSRLDMTMAKLQETQEELNELSAVALKMETLEKEYALLEQKLQASSAVSQKYEQLVAAHAEAKQRLEALASFDPTAAQEKLKRLNECIAAQDSENTMLLAQLGQEQSRLAQLEQTRDSCLSTQKDIQEKNNGLNAEIQQLQADIAQLQGIHNNLLSDVAVEHEKYDQLRHKAAYTTAELEEVRQAISTLENDEALNQQQAELEQAKSNLCVLEENKRTVDEERQTLQQQSNDLLLEIARLSRQLDADSAKLRNDGERRDQLRRDKIRLTAELSGCLRDLEDLQREVDALNKQKLPEAQALCAQEQQRRDALQQQVEQCENELQIYKKDIAKLEDVLPGLKEDVRSEQAIYDGLTASYNTSSTEMNKLKQKIAELRTNDHEALLPIYRAQLKDTQRQLKEIQDECNKLQLENEQKQHQLKAAQDKRATLLDAQRRHDEGLAAVNKRLHELAFAGTDDFLRKVTVLEERAKLLESVRQNLADSVAKMHRILGCSPVEEKASLEGQVRNGLRTLQQQLEDLRRAITSCAEHVNMEVR